MCSIIGAKTNTFNNIKPKFYATIIDANCQKTLFFNFA